MILRTYPYRLYPSKTQCRGLAQTVETCRIWNNPCLEERKTAWETEYCRMSKYEQLAKGKDFRKQNLDAGQLHSHWAKTAPEALLLQRQGSVTKYQ